MGQEPTTKGESAGRPNIVVILADDLGWSDLGCYGGEIRTPQLDALAAGGLRFTQFYNSGRSSPSRAALLTGLYGHQAGVGDGTGDKGPSSPGYRGTLQPHCVTIAEVLQDAGYHAAMVGKWHLHSAQNVLPLDRGFKDFYGLLGGVSSSWHEKPDYQRMPEGTTKKWYSAPNGGSPGTFYSTDAFTDYTIAFMQDAAKAKKPFFLYLAFNAPHYPLQAPEQEVSEYEFRYRKGWDAIREQRATRQLQLGLVSRSFKLPPRGIVPPNEMNGKSPYRGAQNPTWESLPEERRGDLARRMAVYAAMVDRMDRAVGRVVEELKTSNRLDNTLILFLSDNGANGEWDPFGFDGKSGPDNILHMPEDLPAVGGPQSYISYGSAWAEVSNTPWRLYKNTSYEGGVATPLVAHWPAGIKARGELRTQLGHVIDIMPTCLEVAGATYPTEHHGKAITPSEGRSLLPAFVNEPVKREALYWELGGFAAARAKDWKIVRQPYAKSWQLYDMAVDRTERKDVSEQFPKVTEALSDRWLQWAQRSNVIEPMPIQTPTRN